MGGDPINRRQFAGLAATAAGGVLSLGASPGLRAGQPDDWDPDRPMKILGKALKVQPVFMYTTYQRREKTSWKSWSKINTPQAASEEKQRIARELDALAKGLEFPVEFLPLATVTTPPQAQKIHASDYDAVLLFPATGRSDLLRACLPVEPDRDTVIFVRHRSGPAYYWYEAIGTRHLKKGSDDETAQNSAENHGGPTVHDVVVDDYREVAWRLRALYGLKNFIGQRIVALGGAGGKYDPKAPDVARQKYRLDIIDATYDDLTRRIQQARANADLVAKAEKWTDRYLARPHTTLATKRPFLVGAFLLYRIFRDWMREHDAPAFTIGQCMNTVMPIAETTACLPLSWLNDEGFAAFCESDFVIIPPGILLHYIASRPVFLHNSTFPHQGVVTCAHCTAPRRMDGNRYEPVKILTHYESDYGAAPKVEMTVGQEVTFIDPEYATGRWVGFTGKIRDNPFLEICRSQQDVEIQGDWKKLLPEARDSHWMMAYGNWQKETAYAAKKIGIRWADLS